LFCEQKAFFQLVIASDYRTGRSYVLFNYNYIGWQIYQPAAQGYQALDSSFLLYTSYTILSYQLPKLLGNRGKHKKFDRSSVFVNFSKINFPFGLF